jgi:hypothetical protein
MALRFDLVFSYWLFFWYMLYIYKFTQYNPKMLLKIGILENVILLWMMFSFGTKTETIFKFILINTFIKLIPLYTIINTTIHIKDIIAGIVLFIIYIIWVYVNGYSIMEYRNKIFESLILDKNETPFMFLLEKIKLYFKKYTI